LLSQTQSDDEEEKLNLSKKYVGEMVDRVLDNDVGKPYTGTVEDAEPYF
jgi:hypothetical protein